MSPPTRSSPPSPLDSTQLLKHRVLHSLHRLSDRDTHSSAASDLDSLARSLSHDSLSPFLTYISSTDSTHKSPVRTKCVHLLGLLSTAHRDALSPLLPRMLSSVVIRRLRDPDSAVRSACVDSVTLMASHITKPPFSAFLNPFMDAILHEQDQSLIIGSALCLAAAIEASSDPGRPPLMRRILPRLVKLVRSERLLVKAKSALLSLIGSVVVAGGTSGGEGLLGRLVHCMVELLGSEDWGVRKGASEVLVKVGVAERDRLVDFKRSCLAAFEARKFDKVGELVLKFSSY